MTREKVSGQDEGPVREKEVGLRSSASIGKAIHWKQKQISFQNPEQALGCVCVSKTLRITVSSGTFLAFNFWLALGARVTSGQLCSRFGSGDHDLLPPNQGPLQDAVRETFRAAPLRAHPELPPRVLASAPPVVIVGCYCWLPAELLQGAPAPFLPLNP